MADWDGSWLVLAVSIPETQRQLRHQLRTQLTWAGLGSPLPGLWVSPDASKEKDVAAVVAGLGIEAFSFVGPFGGIGQQQRVVEQAWVLDEVERRYGDLLATVEQQRPQDAAGCFRSQVDLVQRWRRFPFLDPALPPALLPSAWPGPAAAELFHERHASWHAAAQQHWDEICTAASARA